MDSALRDLVSTSPLCHLTTLNPDGSPQVTVVWVGVDGDELVTGHLPHNQKVRNMERDPRVVLSFLAPPEPEPSCSRTPRCGPPPRSSPPTTPGTCSTG